MSEHTPGPWRVYTRDLYHHEVMAGTKAIATVGTLDEDYGIEAANARLIAAAPDIHRISSALLHYSQQEEPDAYYLNSLLSELEEILSRVDR